MTMIDMALVARAVKLYLEHPVMPEIATERDRQDELWGAQNHPVHSAEVDPADDRLYYASEAEAWKIANRLRKQNGLLAWDGILLEEVFEALEQEDPAKQRAELVQAAAVVVAMIECLDRRHAQ